MNDMKLIMEGWRHTISEAQEPTVGDFLALYGKVKPTLFKKLLGKSANFLIKMGSAALGGAVGASVSGGLGAVAGAGVATKLTGNVVDKITDKISSASETFAKDLLQRLSTPDGDRGPMDKFFDLDDEYQALVQGMDSELGKRLQKQLFAYYSRKIQKLASTDSPEDLQQPLSSFLNHTANDFFRTFIFKRRMSGIGNIKLSKANQ